MADDISILDATQTARVILADEVTDGTLGTGLSQYVKLMDGTLGGTAKALISAYGLAVDIARMAAVYADENGNVLTVKRASKDITASQTDSSVIAGVGGKKLRVIRLLVLCGAAATTLVFNSKPAGAGVAISPVFQNGANGGFNLDYFQFGHLETTAGEGLSATTGAGATTSVLLSYVEV